MSGPCVGNDRPHEHLNGGSSDSIADDKVAKWPRKEQCAQEKSFSRPRRIGMNNGFTYVLRGICNFHAAHSHARQD